MTLEVKDHLIRSKSDLDMPLKSFAQTENVTYFHSICPDNVYKWGQPSFCELAFGVKSEAICSDGIRV